MNQHVMKRNFFLANDSQAHSFSHEHPARRRARSGTGWDFRAAAAFPTAAFPDLPVPPADFLLPWGREGARQGAGAASRGWIRVSSSLSPVSPGGAGSCRCRSRRGGTAASLAGGTSHAATRSCRDRIHLVLSLPPSPTCAANAWGQKYCRRRRWGCEGPGMKRCLK